ncbi:MAG: zf-TFIIB domain-containing protein [Deltaproteobacteria bacterium]|nr:zf-TFIIB domain-containing protein [Deltaproteobacteria bacterium]MBW2179786.1 zf-TFIIB domain-containing protein [Deltaproteobacteria bacterium]
MVKIDYDKINVEIDYCPKCRGVWLDENSDFKLFQYEMKKIMKNE